MNREEPEQLVIDWLPLAAIGKQPKQGIREEYATILQRL